MRTFSTSLPLSIYIHIPWCVKKCPYCDFNSHSVKGALPEAAYVTKLQQDFLYYLPQIKERAITSVFFGGGTPSLFAAERIGHIIEFIRSHIATVPDLEITLEANPGTVDEKHLVGYPAAGVNRLSLGVQSLNDKHLRLLGRIHDVQAAHSAIQAAQHAGFQHLNLDIMYALPEQTLDEALCDLKTALGYQPDHFSWYQLTIEPNTLFYHQPPVLPDNDWTIQLAGQRYLKQAGFQQYEVSAYAKKDNACRHNLNYWQFGDYLGLGAGAHSKLTNVKRGTVTRFAQTKHPIAYLNQGASEQYQNLSDNDLVFEFMLNALRLTQGFALSLFSQHTGLSLDVIEKQLDKAMKRGVISIHEDRITPTPLGQRYLNDLMGMFL